MKSRENLQNQEDKTSKCPNVLIRNGNMLLLYNSTDSHDEMPVQFNNLDEYVEYYQKQKAAGSDCPVLYLQQENNAQGADVYRIRPSPFDQRGGSMPVTVPTSQNTIIGNNPMTFPPAAALINANMTHPPFNANNYPGFDPYGLQQGTYSQLDQVHNATRLQKVSDNPMDPNWGGVNYTNSVVDSGKYIDNLVYAPNFSKSGNTQFFPGLFSSVIPDPPNMQGTAPMISATSSQPQPQ
jgi:hypothetical protein